MIAATSVALAYVALRRGPGTIVVSMLLVAVLGSLVFSLLSAQDGDAFGFIGRDSTLTGRGDLWPSILQMIDMKFWTGWGYEAFWTPDNPYYEFIRHQAGWPAPNSHNGLLEMALDLGVLGVGVFFTVMGWAVFRAIRLIFRGANLGIIILIVLVDLTISNITESFVLESTIFGWNFLTMLIFYTGLGRAPVNRLHQRPAGSILDRAKPRAEPRAAVAATELSET
jgi:O-antigen ligase